MFEAVRFNEDLTASNVCEERVFYRSGFVPRLELYL